MESVIWGWIVSEAKQLGGKSNQSAFAFTKKNIDIENSFFPKLDERFDKPSIYFQVWIPEFEINYDLYYRYYAKTGFGQGEYRVSVDLKNQKENNRSYSTLFTDLHLKVGDVVSFKGDIYSRNDSPILTVERDKTIQTSSLFSQD